MTATDTNPSTNSDTHTGTGGSQMIWKKTVVHNYSDLVFCFNHLTENGKEVCRLWSLFELLCPDARTILGLCLGMIEEEPRQILFDLTGVNPMVLPIPTMFATYEIDFVENPTAQAYYNIPEEEWNPSKTLYLYQSDGLPKPFAKSEWHRFEFKELLFCQKVNNVADVIDDKFGLDGWFRSRFDSDGFDYEKAFGLADENLVRVHFDNSAYPIATKAVVVRAEIGGFAMARPVTVEYPTGANENLIELFIMNEIHEGQKRLAREISKKIAVAVVDGDY